jgi:hypothetical protein
MSPDLRQKALSPSSSRESRWKQHFETRTFTGYMTISVTYFSKVRYGYVAPASFFTAQFPSVLKQPDRSDGVASC